MIDAASFKKRHWHVDKQVRGRFKRLKAHEAEWRADIEWEMAPENERYLYANNAGARVSFSEVFADALRSEALRHRDRTYFWVTLCWSKHEVPLQEARAFEIRRVKSATYEVLQKTSFVGMVEAGFNSVTQTVDWHAHALVWDVPSATLKSRLRQAGSRPGGGASGKLNVYTEVLSSEDVAGLARYMCKGQIKEYRTWEAKVEYEAAYRDTGEVLSWVDYEARRRSRDIQPINAYRMYEVFRDRFIDDFAFAARRGVEVLGRVAGRSLRCERREARLDALGHWIAEERRLAGRAGVRATKRDVRRWQRAEAALRLVGGRFDHPAIATGRP